MGDLWQKLLSGVGSIQGSLLGMVDKLIPPPPVELTQACGAVTGALRSSSWASELVPVPQLVVGFATIAVIIGAVIVIRLVRIVASLFSGGGGA